MGNLSIIRNIPIMTPLVKCRDWFMNKTGLFGLKRKIKQRLFFSRLLKEDAKKKKKISSLLRNMPNDFISNVISDKDVIVSLTSYGKRVEDSLPYALYSLLKQTIIPKKIIVYIDEKIWSDDNIPQLLKELKRIGVTICYCEDLRSHTKLLHALRQFPNNPIITVDDDLYYNKQSIEWLINAYQSSDKKTIFGTWGCKPQKVSGKYTPYSQWKVCKFDVDEDNVSLYGVGSCCYPPHIFDDEIFNKDVFLKLCPTADDIWFWIQEERLGIKRKYVGPYDNGFHEYVNRIEEYDMKQQGTLMFQNVTNGKNDIQLKKLLQFYNLDCSSTALFIELITSSGYLKNSLFSNRKVRIPRYFFKYSVRS